MPVVSMSKKEFDRLEVLLGVQSGRLRVADACELLGLKRRQVFRLLAGLKHGGAASLGSKRRGRPSNNRLPEAYRELALSLVREQYADFGPTLAAEKLAEVPRNIIPIFLPKLRRRFLLSANRHGNITELSDMYGIIRNTRFLHRDNRGLPSPTHRLAVLDDF